MVDGLSPERVFLSYRDTDAAGTALMTEGAIRNILRAPQAKSRSGRRRIDKSSEIPRVCSTLDDGLIRPRAAKRGLPWGHFWNTRTPSFPLNPNY
jgi:hypothetical protein